MVKQVIPALLVSFWLMNIQSLAAKSATENPSSNGGLTLSEARRFMLSLVNADRAKYHLHPLTLDATASAAGQMHTDEMAKIGYLSHWDKAGRKCWQRYTECGGRHAVSENLCELNLPNNKPFSAAQLSDVEALFMGEKAPNDGHRQNILDPTHNKLGVGISQSVKPDGKSKLYLAQEFLNDYGEYSSLPKKIARGANFEIFGSLSPGVSLHSLQLDWEPKPEVKTDEDLKDTGAGGYGDFIIASLSPGDPEIKVWKERGRQHFSAKVILEKKWKPGLYFVTVNVTSPKFKTLFAASTRTCLLE